MRKALWVALALALALAWPASAVTAAEYRWLNSWNANFPPVNVFAKTYQKAVETATKGRITFNVSGPETVPTFEQFQPLTSGAFQFLYTHGAFHFGISPLLAAVEALGGTPEQRRKSRVFDAVDKHYQKLGAKLVAIAMTPDEGYQIVLRKPVTASGDLQGYKIRGNPTYLPLLQMLGASMVTLPPNEVYSALDKGVVDGFAWLSYGVVESRLHEPSKYLLRPGFGYNAQVVLANLNTWNRLSEEDRKILIEEGEKAAAHWLKESTRLIAEEEKNLQAKGLQVTLMGDAQKAKLKRAWSDGLWEIAAKTHKKEVDELRAIARSEGLD
jgi:TRAP-type C4-dicarboxylate transport system substrate-binding protein